MSVQLAKATPSDVSSELKRDQILAGARKVFMARGFAAASMGEIAKAAEVSKGTLYVYFENKNALFHALIDEQKRNTAERITEFDPADHDVEAVLTSFARRFIVALTEPDHIALVRVVIGASAEFPELSRAFFESGAAHGARRLAAYLAAQEMEGVLKVDTPEDAAWRFIGMCNVPSLVSMIMGMPRPDAAEIDRRARANVTAFLAASR